MSICIIFNQFASIGLVFTTKSIARYNKISESPTLAGASLSVLAVLCISIYGKNPFLTLASIILGIGHIGIHLQYQNIIKKDNQ